MINIKKINKLINGNKILQNINLDLPNNGLIVVRGENGSGKSTLLNIISTMDDNYNGNIFFDGINYDTLNDSDKSIFREKYISYCFQKNNLISFLDVSQNENLDKLLSNSKFVKNKNNILSNLSQGQQQSIALSNILKPGKKIYLLDEVTACLDSSSTSKLIEEVKSLSKQALVVIVSHDIELSNIADQIITLEKGQIIENKIINYNDGPLPESDTNYDRKFSFELFLSYLKSINVTSIIVLFLNILLTCFLFVGVIGATTSPKQALDSVIDDFNYLTTSVKGGVHDEELLNTFPDNCRKFVSCDIEYETHDKELKTISGLELIFDDVEPGFVCLSEKYYEQIISKLKNYTNVYVKFGYEFNVYNYDLKIDNNIKEDGLFINTEFLNEPVDYNPSVTILNGYWDTKEYPASYYHQYIQEKSTTDQIYGYPIYVNENYASELINKEIDKLSDDTLYIFDERLYTDEVTFFERQPLRTVDMDYEYNLYDKFSNGVKIEFIGDLYDSPNTLFFNYILVSENTFEKMIEGRPIYKGIYIDFTTNKNDIISFLSNKLIKLSSPNNIEYDDFETYFNIHNQLKIYNSIVVYNANFASNFWTYVLIYSLPFIFIAFQFMIGYFINFVYKKDNIILKKYGLKQYERYLLFNSPFIINVIISIIVGFNLGMYITNPMQVFGFIPQFTLSNFLISLLIILITGIIFYLTFKRSERI